MIKPIIAAVIVCRALSTFALSPADIIHRMPPQIRKKSAINAAATRIKATAAPTIGPILFALRLQSLLNCPELPQGLTFAWANADEANPKYVPAVRSVVTSFFISIPS